MSKKKNNGDGPGLAGLFTSGEPAYRYMGPIDMSAVGFTESALNRAVSPNELHLEDNVDLAPYNALAMKGGGNNRTKLATGKRFTQNAKFLNDIYDLTKRHISGYNSEAGAMVAPMILTDKIADKDDENVMAYFDPDSQTITHPVFQNLNFNDVGYYKPRSSDVVVGSRTDSPQSYRDSFVNLMTGEKLPVINSAIPHEVAHSLDIGPEKPFSVYDPVMRSHIVKDMYYHPRKYVLGEDTPVVEVAAEYMVDALRTGLAEQYPKLQSQYDAEGSKIPYERIASNAPMNFSKDTPETTHMATQLASAASSEKKNPYTKTPVADALDIGDQAGVNSSERAKFLYDLLMSDQPNKKYARQSIQSKRAKGHLDFLDWYFPNIIKKGVR